MSNCVPSAGEGEVLVVFFECESLNSVVAGLDREANSVWTFRRTLRVDKCTLSAHVNQD